MLEMLQGATDLQTAVDPGDWSNSNTTAGSASGVVTKLKQDEEHDQPCEVVLARPASSMAVGVAVVAGELSSEEQVLIEAAWADIEPHVVISFSLPEVLARLQRHPQQVEEVAASEITISVATAAPAAAPVVEIETAAVAVAVAPANERGGVLHWVASLFSCFRPPTQRGRQRGGHADDLGEALTAP